MSSRFNDIVTKPTIETVLERINAMEDRLQSQIGAVQQNVDAVRTNFDSLRNEFQLFRAEIEIRLDRLESLGNKTCYEFLDFRADFKELSARFPSPG